MTKFEEQILHFNHTFGLPAPALPVPPDNLRMLTFMKMLHKEFQEGLEVGVAIAAQSTGVEHPTVLLADWLGDIIVYCASEMQRHGLPIQGVLDVIMRSNMSKLGADGRPIVIDGKVQKGPNFIEPEAELAKLLEVENDS